MISFVVPAHDEALLLGRTLVAIRAAADTIGEPYDLTVVDSFGNEVWSTRANWCKVFGKMGPDSVSIAILDHPRNPNYPTFWHARGYGLFAANPLGEKIFTNGKSARNLQLKKGEAVTFHYRILIDEGRRTLTTQQLNAAAASFARKSIAANR